MRHECDCQARYGLRFKELGLREKEQLPRSRRKYSEMEVVAAEQFIRFHLFSATSLRFAGLRYARLPSKFPPTETDP